MTQSNLTMFEVIGGWRFLKADSTLINHSSGLVIQNVGSFKLEGYPWGCTATSWDPADPEATPDVEPVALDPEAVPDDPDVEPRPPDAGWVCSLVDMACSWKRLRSEDSEDQRRASSVWRCNSNDPINEEIWTMRIILVNWLCFIPSTLMCTLHRKIMNKLFHEVR